MKISACCIIKNEERNLPAYIEGVRGVADEIIIVDTGSEDNSVKLLENLKNKYDLNLTVYHFEWINDFAAAKNFALSKAVGEWIMFMDADEYFDKKDRKEIRPLLESLLPDESVVFLQSKLVNIDVAKNNIPISESSQTRIFRHIPEIRYEGAIHEHLAYAGEKSVVTSYTTDFTIIHTGYSSNIFHSKIARNNEIILANKNLAGDDYPSYYIYIADAYAAKGDYPAALQNIQKAVELLKKSDDIFLIAAYVNYYHIKELAGASKEELSDFLDLAAKETNRHPDILAEKLILMSESDEFNPVELKELAIEIIERAKDKDLRDKYTNKMNTHLPYAHHILGCIYKENLEYKKAEEEFLTALKDYKYHPPILSSIISFNEGNNKKISKIIDEYYDRENPADKGFLEKIFEGLPRDALYRKYYSKPTKNTVDYKLASGKTTEAIKLAAKEAEAAKSANLPPDEYKKNLREKLYVLSICYFFLDPKEISKVEKELNILPSSIIAVILRFYGENLPPVDGEAASYNAIKNTANIYLPKKLREKFFGLKIA